MGWEVIFWNHTPFDLNQLGYKEIKLQGKPRAFTDLLKRAKITSELDYWTHKFTDPVYKHYKFPSSKKNLKGRVKNIIVNQFISWTNGEAGLERLRNKMRESERNGAFYKHCKTILENEKPALLFCTNQRPVNAIAPITAAQDMGIPTASFIFSWDNIPKATMVVQADYYLVWSEYMKKELQKYYPFIAESQIQITGTPQFEPHFEESLKISKQEFYNNYGLDNEKIYLCYSGDDITTSPHDELYLEHVAEAVSELNKHGENIGVIFRRNPADFSKRYDPIINKYKKLITPLDPLWERQGNEWNQLLPTKDDLKLQSQIIQHTFMVINLGSSMVFDYQIYQKPCAYLNYNPSGVKIKKNVREIYNYVHFRSMLSEKPVLWINSKKEIKEKIQEVINGETAQLLKDANTWFKRINCHPSQNASKRIWTFLDKLSR
ncbi:UDP-glycosyltransferase [Christiangramia sp. SM2212]|uniref:UDP-glycosyltransferase n=1 Tax=Christiangramia sediminicola TaxID=3073267 RepID=A0ABU1ENE0_9FLAO|nr:UDP-glycosyltransferase [Christiangramia sp. SM2212]MDR5589688.1 UDP-glycosyltransferase [Christiangramia sp. SM2212]